MASKNTTLINSPILGIILSEDVQRKNNIKIMLSTWTACFLFWFTNSSNERSFGHTFLLSSWVVCITVHVQVNFQCKYILTTFSFGYFLMESRVVIRKLLKMWSTLSRLWNWIMLALQPWDAFLKHTLLEGSGMLLQK